MKELAKYRKIIDELDRDILDLLGKRADAAVEIGKIKARAGARVYDPTREAAIMAKLKKMNRSIPEKSLRAIYTEIISATKALEKPPVVAYLGPDGTFSHEAALKVFGSSCVQRPVAGMEAVCLEVEKGAAEYGVLPVENSIEGPVNLSLDLLGESTLNIIGEKSIAAHQNLVSREKGISSIKKLFSHPQPLSQCRRFIARNLPGVTLVETSSTAAAAQRAAKEKNSAAISSMTAARIYALNVLRERVEDFPNNFTRFVILSRETAGRTGDDKTSIAVTIKNRPGELYNLLGIFNSRKINLSKIVSRPIPRSAWTYLFYIDFEGHREDKKVGEVLKLITKRTEMLKILGSYPRES